MRTTEERACLALTKGKRLRKKREVRLISWLLCINTVCVICLAVFMNSFVGSGCSSVSEFYGASLLFNDAGAYVLLGVVAFVLGACFTGLCLFAKYKYDKKSTDSSEEEEMQ